MKLWHKYNRFWRLRVYYFWIRDVIRCFFFCVRDMHFLVAIIKNEMWPLHFEWTLQYREAENSRLRFENCTKSILFSSFGWRANNKKISPSRIRISNRDKSLITIRHCITNSCPLPLHVRHKKKSTTHRQLFSP
jgi:hypothetical protein